MQKQHDQQLVWLIWIKYCKQTFARVEESSLRLQNFWHGEPLTITALMATTLCTLHLLLCTWASSPVAYSVTRTTRARQLLKPWGVVVKLAVTYVCNVARALTVRLYTWSQLTTDARTSGSCVTAARADKRQSFVMSTTAVRLSSASHFWAFEADTQVRGNK